MDEFLIAELDRLLRDPGRLMALGAVLAALGAIVMISVIVSIVRVIRTSVVARLPILGEHALELPRPGPFALHLEGPMLSRMPGGPFLQVPGVHLGGPRLALRDAATGEDVPLQAPLLPTRSSGFSRARHMIRVFNAPKAGRYVLAVDGVDPQRDWSGREFVVTLPYGFRMLVSILAAITGLFTLMAGLAMMGLSESQRLGL